MLGPSIEVGFSPPYHRDFLALTPKNSGKTEYPDNNHDRSNPDHVVMILRLHLNICLALSIEVGFSPPYQRDIPSLTMKNSCKTEYPYNNRDRNNPDHVKMILSLNLNICLAQSIEVGFSPPYHRDIPSLTMKNSCKTEYPYNNRDRNNPDHVKMILSLNLNICLAQSIEVGFSPPYHRDIPSLTMKNSCKTEYPYNNHDRNNPDHIVMILSLNLNICLAHQ
ncbi:hypothetical protein [Chryseobacterium pennipullorum]|uniref:hypothetical protein n=1 Tax=Chryseobacterium pennipullorum TaxID=2258963 RepID=UPI000F505856|nr:hypothetical protein [Chryseobacterium pennipullorum]